MSNELAELLDLREAWIRVKKESRSRPYLSEPFEIPLIEVDQRGWLTDLMERVRQGYKPALAETLELPKGMGATRPIGRLSLDDRVVYTALLGACHEAIRSGLGWSAGTVDFSHQLSADERSGWLKAPVGGWALFREKSLDTLKDSDASWVVTTDITAFYENIDIQTLVSDLTGLGAPPLALRLLSKMLNKWAAVSGRGLPQGSQASDIFSKVYLNPVDLWLRNEGWHHLRYSDDLRVFCGSRTDALALLRDLARVLRARGLHLQSAKSKILPASKAPDVFEGVVPTLRSIRERLLGEMVNAHDLENPYLTSAELDALLSDRPDDAPVEVLREAFNDFFAGDMSQPFDKTLLHFLLNRLGAANDGHALPHLIRLLRNHPEETEYILGYIDSISAFDVMEDALLEHLKTREAALYDWQRQQILSWLDARPLAPGSPSVDLARRLAISPGSSRHVRAISRRIVGRWGNVADIESLQSAYRTASNDLERAQILCSLKRMEKARRNSFLARAEEDGSLPARAVALVRASQGGAA